MMKQRRFLIVGICATATLLTANAQENESVESETPVVVAGTPAAAETKQGALPELKFADLVRVVNIQGTCEVNNPDIGSYQPAKHNKAYPMGSIFRTAAGSKFILIFSPTDSATIEENSELQVTTAPNNSQSLIIKLMAGEVKTNLRDNLPNGSFSVSSPNCQAINMSGRGSYILTMENGEEVFKASTITGTAKIQGLHYTIPALQAANKVHITTTPNRSFSSLTSVSGDFAIELANGTDQPIVFSMSPKALVKIWRENAPVGGRTIVSTLVVSPTGMARHRFAYAEGRTALKTGELVNQGDGENPVEELPVLLDEKKESADLDAPAL